MCKYAEGRKGTPFPERESSDKRKNWSTANLHITAVAGLPPSVQLALVECREKQVQQTKLIAVSKEMTTVSCPNYGESNKEAKSIQQAPNIISLRVYIMLLKEAWAL